MQQSDERSMAPVAAWCCTSLAIGISWLLEHTALPAPLSASVPSHYSEAKELVQPSCVHRNFSLHLLLGAVNLNFSVGYFFS